MTHFLLRPLHSFLISLVNLPSIILHVYLHPWMHPFFITHRTHWISIHHSTTERINYSLKIHLIFHLPFPETQRMDFSASHLPLCLIHQIMRMPMKLSNFMIIAIVIHLLPYSIMIMILSLLIFQSHWFMTMKLKHPRLLRHFSLN